MVNEATPPEQLSLERDQRLDGHAQRPAAATLILTVLGSLLAGIVFLLLTSGVPPQ
jgi:hypothetical protein